MVRYIFVQFEIAPIYARNICRNVKVYLSYLEVYEVRRKKKFFFLLHGNLLSVSSETLDKYVSQKIQETKTL